MNKLPPTFCWTKMGTEASEELTVIIRRKEWERQLGNGYFLWGIGQSLGKNAKVASRDIPSLRAIFSPMLSKPKVIDVAPDEVVLWNAWVDAQGQTRQLPLHCFVTSRASLPSGRKKESHYALVCFSDREIHQSQMAQIIRTSMAMVQPLPSRCKRILLPLPKLCQTLPT